MKELFFNFIFSSTGQLFILNYFALNILTLYGINILKKGTEGQSSPNVSLLKAYLKVFNVFAIGITGAYFLGIVKLNL